MKEISKEKTFYEMAETVFQERKEKLEAIKKREEEEKLKKREERIKRIAIICLNIFSESTKNTQNSQDFVTQIYIKITYCCGMAIGRDCEIRTSNDKCYNTENCSNTPNYKYLGEYLAKTYLETKRRPIYILRETSEDNCKEISRGPGYERTAD